MADLTPLRMVIRDSYRLIPTLRAQSDQVADQVAYLPPLENGDSRSIPIDSYSETSGRSGGRSSGRSNPSPVNGYLRFILIDSHFEISGSPVGRSSG